MIRPAFALLAVVALTGCSLGSGAERTEDQLFELAPQEPGAGLDFYGTSVRQVDPQTFLPVGRAVPLGDSATSVVVSPDRSTLAFGGNNFHEVVLFETSSMRSRMLRLRKSGSRYVEVFSWPRPETLIAGSCLPTGHSGCYSARLWILDPARPKSRQSFPLKHHPTADFDPRTGRTFLVVPGLRRLVVAERDGRLRSLPLRIRPATFALDGGLGKGIAVAPRAPLAEIDLRTLTVRYRRVEGLDPSEAEVARAPLQEHRGTAEPENSSGRDLWSLGRGRFVVVVREERARGRFAARYLVRSLVLDARRWHVTRSAVGFPGHEPGGLLLRNVRAEDRSARRARPFLLEARDGEGRLRYRLDGAGRRLFTWRAGAGLLYAGRLDGHMTHVFDLASGKHLARIPPREIDYEPVPAILRLPPAED